MKQCWDGNPNKRPTAKECHERMVKPVSPKVVSEPLLARIMNWHLLEL